MTNQTNRPIYVKLPVEVLGDNHDTDTEKDINLYHLLKFYASKWMTILVLTTIGVVLGFVYNNYIQTPVYESKATLLLVVPFDANLTQDTSSINNYVELFKSRRVLEPVIADLNMDTTYDDLIDSVSATNQKNTQVINVSISTKNSFVSQSFISGAIDSFKKQATELYGKDNVQIVDNASFDAEPVNVHVEMQLAMTAVAGFIVSVISLFFVYDFKLNAKTAKQEVFKKKESVKPVVAKKVVNKSKAIKVTKKPAKNIRPSSVRKVMGVLIGQNRIDDTKTKHEVASESSDESVQHIKNEQTSLLHDNPTATEINDNKVVQTDMQDKKNEFVLPTTVQEKGSVFYAEIKTNHLDRRGQPYKFNNGSAEDRYILNNRIRRDR